MSTQTPESKKSLWFGDNPDIGEEVVPPKGNAVIRDLLTRSRSQKRKRISSTYARGAVSDEEKSENEGTDENETKGPERQKTKKKEKLTKRLSFGETSDYDEAMKGEEEEEEKAAREMDVEKRDGKQQEEEEEESKNNGDSSSTKDNLPKDWADLGEFIGLNQYSMGADIKREREKMQKERREKEKEMRQGTVPWAKDYNGGGDRSYRKLYSENRHLALHEEVLDFALLVSPTPEDHSRREDVLRRVQHVADTVVPDSVVKPFGSFATRLYLPSSDVDCVMLLPNRSVSMSKNQTAKLMYRIIGELRKRKMVSHAEAITRARVPIIKFTDKDTGIQVDMCFNMESGLQSAALMNRFLGQYHCLRPLIFVLKFFLKSRSLNEPYTGGIGSYMLQLLLISHLQRNAWMFDARERGGVSEPELQPSLGTLLHSFFSFYGRYFNSRDLGICITDGGSYFSLSDYDMQHESDDAGQLVMLNPLDVNHDVGRPSYRYHIAKKAFHTASDILSAPLGPLSDSFSLLEKILPVDDRMI